MTTLILGMGHDNPAFRQLFTAMFIPGATQEQMKWFNDLQKVTASPLTRAGFTTHWRHGRFRVLGEGECANSSASRQGRLWRFHSKPGKRSRQAYLGRASWTSTAQIISCWPTSPLSPNSSARSDLLFLPLVRLIEWTFKPVASVVISKAQQIQRLPPSFTTAATTLLPTRPDDHQSHGVSERRIPDEDHSVIGGGGVRLHVREWGKSAAPTILLIHGWSQNHLCWRKHTKAS